MIGFASINSYSLHFHVAFNAHGYLTYWQRNGFNFIVGLGVPF